MLNWDFHNRNSRNAFNDRKNCLKKKRDEHGCDHSGTLIQCYRFSFPYFRFMTSHAHWQYITSSWSSRGDLNHIFLEQPKNWYLGG